MNDTNTTTISVSRFYPPALIAIDSDEGTATIAIRVRRLSRGEALEAAEAFAACDDDTRESRRAIFRKPDGDEREADERGIFTISDDEIRARRLSEMTADQRRAHLELEAREKRAQIDACAQIVEKFVEVAPTRPDGTRQRVEIDGREIRTGRELVDTFDGNLAVLGVLAGSVIAETTLSPEKKRRSGWPSDSSIGSRPTPSAHGPTPGATVADVAPPGSVPSDGAGA